LRAPFVINRIDPALFSKPAVVFAGKLPKAADPCGRTVYTNPSIENDHMVVSKIDYQKSANNSIFARYFRPPDLHEIKMSRF
jgi:hypothetical protein